MKTAREFDGDVIRPGRGLDFAVMIVGGQKCGTTSLLDHLLGAPGVAELTRPEVGYFTDPYEYSRGADVATRKYFGVAGLPDDLRVGKEAGILTTRSAVRRLLEDSPGVQLVVVVRNPVDRAYSAYWHARRKGFEPAASFRQAIRREQQGDQLTIPRQDLRDYVKRGEYDRHLEFLYAQCGTQRVTTFLFEELVTDLNGVAEAVLEPFGHSIGSPLVDSRRSNGSARARSQWLARAVASQRLRRAIRPVVPPKARRSLGKSLNRLNETSFRPPPMEMDIRRELGAHFRPHNERLASLIGRELSDWDEATL